MAKENKNHNHNDDVNDENIINKSIHLIHFILSYKVSSKYTEYIVIRAKKFNLENIIKVKSNSNFYNLIDIDYKLPTII